MKKSPSQFKNEILNLVKSKHTVPEMAKLLDLNKSSISRFLRNLNISTKYSKSPIDYHSELVPLFEKKVSFKEIAKSFKLNINSVSSYSNRLGYTYIPTISNPSYFSTIDTHLKAYFLGFIAADGALVKPYPKSKTHTLTITLDKKDVCVLETLKKELQMTHELQTITRKMEDYDTIINHKRLTITNQQISNDLITLGITPRKTFTIGNIFLNIPKEFRTSLALGYFDGDGNVCLPKGTRKFVKSKNKFVTYPSRTLICSIKGTEKLLQGIVDSLNLNQYRLRKYKNQNIYTLTFAKKEEVLKLFNCYNNLPFFLERKYNKFLQRIN